MPTRFTDSSVSYNNDNSTNNSQSQIATLPTNSNMQQNQNNIQIDSNRILNPLEISQVLYRD